MNALLAVSSAIELGAGLALLFSPTLAARFLFDAELDAPSAVALGRIGGAALLSIGVACWLARAGSRPVTAGMLVYNVGAVAVFATYGLGGILQWPAVAMHAAMALWCIASLRSPTLKS